MSSSPSPRSSTAVSSQSITPLFTDEYLRAGLSDPSSDADDPPSDTDSLPPAFSLSPSPSPSPPASHTPPPADSNSDDEDDGVAHLPVDDLTDAQLRTIQSELTATLSSKHASLSSLHQAARALPVRASSAAPSLSFSALHAQLASKETDLFIAAALGSALSDRNEQLEAALHEQARRIAALEAAVAARAASSVREGDGGEEEVARSRAAVQRAVQRQALSEGHYKEALATAKKARREVAERAKREQHEGKLREAGLQGRLLEAEEQLRRAVEEVEHLHAVEEERAVRERQLRRSREVKTQVEEEERRRWREEVEERERAVEELERRVREEGRRREEAERRCGGLEKQREEAVAALREAALEMDRRKRRWEELDKARSRSAEEASERQRQQLQALTLRMSTLEEEAESNREEGSRATSSISLSQAQSTPASTTSSPSLYALSPFISPAPRLPAVVAATAATPASVGLQQQRMKAASTPSAAAVYPVPLHLIASPSPTASIPLTPSEPSPPSVAAEGLVDGKEVRLQVQRSLEGELRLSSPQSLDELAKPLLAVADKPTDDEVHAEEDEDGLQSDRLALEAMIDADAPLLAEQRSTSSWAASTPRSTPAAKAPLSSPSLSAFVASPLPYLQPQSFHTRPAPAAAPLRTAGTLTNGFSVPRLSPAARPASTAWHASKEGQSAWLRSSTSVQVQQAYSTLLHTRLARTLCAPGPRDTVATPLQLS